MKKLNMLLLFFSIAACMAFMQMPLLAGGPLDDSVKAEVEEELEKAGIMGCTVELNQRIDVPESENPYFDESKYDDEAEASLWAMVIKPKRVLTEGPQPTILKVTAYKKEIMGLMVAPLVAYGYNVVVVDMRGTASSEGHWNSMSFIESYDVKYIIDHWIPSQPWSNGVVGMQGASYEAILQMLVAGLVDCDENGEPLHLKACFAKVPYSDVYADIGIHGGNFNLEFMSFWIMLTEMLSVMPGTLYLGEDAMLPYSVVDGRTEALQEATDEWMTSIRQFPEPLYDLIFEADNDMRSEDLWQKSPILFWPDKPAGGWDVGVRNEGDRVFPSKLPVFISGGWYDIFTRGCLNQYTYALKNHSAEDKALIMGEWYHLGGAIGLGLTSMIDCSLSARWFNWKLRGEDDCFMKEFPVLLRVMGADRWRAEKEWPLPESRVEHKSLYLSKKEADPIEDDFFTNDSENQIYSLEWNKSECDLNSGNPMLKHAAIAQSFHGTGSRSTVRWLMGIQALVSQVSRILMGYDIQAAQFFEDERNDDWKIPTFTTPPLEEDVEIVGPVALRFWARTDFKDRSLIDAALQDSIMDMLGSIFGIDVDNCGVVQRAMYSNDVQFVAELNDVFPDGRARNITSGWLRASTRQRDLNEPSGTTEHAIDPDYEPFDPLYFGPTSNPEYINEDELYEYVVELWPTCNVFKEGHRIRITLTGSDWPHLMPILVPSWNELVIDDTHDARLDFTVTNTAHEGDTWKWVTEESYGYFALDDYLLEHRDSSTTGDDGSTGYDDDDGSSGNGDSGSSDNTPSGKDNDGNGDNTDISQSADSTTDGYASSYFGSGSTGCGTAAEASVYAGGSRPIFPGLLSTMVMMLIPLMLMGMHRRVRRRRKKA